jgi:hypothetical protein
MLFLEWGFEAPFPFICWSPTSMLISGRLTSMYNGCPPGTFVWLRGLHIHPVTRDWHAQPVAGYVNPKQVNSLPLFWLTIPGNILYQPDFKNDQSLNCKISGAAV